jgi:hypothetical protein
VLTVNINGRNLTLSESQDTPPPWAPCDELGNLYAESHSLTAGRPLQKALEDDQGASFINA